MTGDDDHWLASQPDLSDLLPRDRERLHALVRWPRPAAAGVLRTVRAHLGMAAIRPDW